MSRIPTDRIGTTESTSYFVGEALGSSLGVAKGFDLLNSEEATQPESKELRDLEDIYVTELKARLNGLDIGKDLEFSLENLSSWEEKGSLVFTTQ